MPNIDLRPDFGEKLRERRIARHLSESELAATAGLTYRTVRELETGRRRRVMERTLFALAASLEVTVEELAGPLEVQPPRRLPWRLLMGAVAVLIIAGFLGTAHMARTRAVASADVCSTGVRITRRSRNSSGNEAATPLCSMPAIGCGSPIRL